MNTPKHQFYLPYLPSTPGLTLGVLFLKFAGNKEIYLFMDRLFPKDMEAL